MADTIQEFEISRIQQLKHDLGYFGSRTERSLHELNRFVQEMESNESLKPLAYMRSTLQHLLYKLNLELNEMEREAFRKIDREAA